MIRAKPAFVLGPVAPTSAPGFSAAELQRVQTFYAGRPDLAPTPLRSLPSLAPKLGIGTLLVKDESSRFGLPAFKVVGVAYAVDQLLADGRLRAGDVVACATAGNHGRAVAHVARERGLRARVYVPAGTIRPRIDAIAADGAEVVVHDRGYDDAVAAMASEAARRGWTILSDTTWPGAPDDPVPRLIMAGYTRLLDEAAAVWEAPPDVMFVQAGVGGLLAAAAAWTAGRRGPGGPAPHVVSCEPAAAACVLAAAHAGHPTVLKGPLDTAMVGLRCAEVSHAAWPIIAAHVRAFVAVDDQSTFEAMRTLARPPRADPPVVAGPSGACGLACLTAVMGEPALEPVRRHIRLDSQSRGLVINTEGNTDPSLYNRIVGSS